MPTTEETDVITSTRKSVVTEPENLVELLSHLEYEECWDELRRHPDFTHDLATRVCDLEQESCTDEKYRNMDPEIFKNIRTGR